MRACTSARTCSVSLLCIRRGPITSAAVAPRAPGRLGASAPSARPLRVPHRAQGTPRRSSRS
eukprot:15467180-Alexandrium_andersonii.AAC.1